MIIKQKGVQKNCYVAHTFHNLVETEYYSSPNIPRVIKSTTGCLGKVKQHVNGKFLWKT
jgi:hypothetical protein